MIQLLIFKYLLFHLSLLPMMQQLQVDIWSIIYIETNHISLTYTCLWSGNEFLKGLSFLQPHPPFSDFFLCILVDLFFKR